MTIIHVLHFSIPIGSMLVIGYLLDKMSKPAKTEKTPSLTNQNE